ncbi:MAG: hypothetical protein ACTS5A_03005 [Candidatus Hodgkinia cicadicola]
MVILGTTSPSAVGLEGPKSWGIARPSASIQFGPSNKLTAEVKYGG